MRWLTSFHVLETLPPSPRKPGAVLSALLEEQPETGANGSTAHDLGSKPWCPEKIRWESRRFPGDNQPSADAHGSFLFYEVGSAIGHYDPRLDFPTLSSAAPFDAARLHGVLTAEGFITPPDDFPYDAISFDGREAAMILPPEAFLDRETLSEAISSLPTSLLRLHIYYFRSMDELRLDELRERLVLKRIPVDISI